MKMLLTSAGITNQSIASALVELVGKSPEEIKVGFISTAANVEEGNKDWYIRQLTNLYKYGITWVDVFDISVPEVDWRKRLSGVDVVMVSGGNTFYLLDQMRKVGFGEWLKSELGDKVYVGISAGSIVPTPSIAIASVDNGDVNVPNLTDLTGVSLVDFEVSPHTPEHVSHEGNTRYAESSGRPLYGIDDQSAIRVVDGLPEPISEGKWCKY